MNIMLNDLHKRILEISEKHDLSHLGSNLTAVNIIETIFCEKKIDEKFILSCGHAGLALYVVMEKHGFGNAEMILGKCGIHPDSLKHHGIDCSTGSLGQGLPIALGLSLSDRSKNVYVLISDGEIAEGTTWEVANAMRKFEVKNLKIHLNYNGWGAYDPIPYETIYRVLDIFPYGSVVLHETRVEDYGLEGQSAHYVKTKSIQR